jgi:hypothetical protein
MIVLSTQIRRRSIRLRIEDNPQKTRTYTLQRVKVGPWTIRNLSNRKSFVRVQPTYPGRNAGIEQRADDNPNHHKPKTPHSTLLRRPFCVDPSASTLHRRPFCVDPNRTDEYAYRPATPKPLFARASETLGKLQIDPRRIEKTSKPIRPLYDFELCKI